MSGSAGKRSSDVDGGGFDKDLGLCEEYVDLQDGALDERLKDVEVDYTPHTN